MSFVSELKRRNVFRVAAAYLVVGWLLTEVLTTILPTLGAPDWAAKVVIRVFVFGFILAVILSWIYELTPEGIKRDADVDQDHSTGRRSITTLEYTSIAAVVLVIVFIAFFSARQDPIDTSMENVNVSDNSIAVLPFVNMSQDEDADYFSDGLTETLLHMLAQVPGLKVAARTSSFAFKDKNIDVRQIADALGVAHILEGSVQQAGNRVRITAQLIRAGDGFHVWSESYDRTIDDIFTIQDEIATKVGGALSVSLLGAQDDSKVASVNTVNPDAYDLYLQALKERATYSYGGLIAAEQLLMGALRTDPDFLDAKTALADNYLHQLETGMMNPNDAITAAVSIADEVLAVRPGDAGAQAIRLFARAAPHSRIRSADIVFESVRQLETLVSEHPRQYRARVLLTRLLQGLNQRDRALELQLDALQRDPYNARIHYEVGSLYLELDRIAEARTALQKSLQIEPRQPNAYLRLSVAALKSGDGVEYVRQQLKAMVADPKDHEIPGHIAGFLYELGLIEEGDDFRNRVLDIAPTSEIAYRIELLRAINTGDADAGLAAARRAIEDDVDDRAFAYGGAVQHLLRIAVTTGSVEDEIAYLEQHAPGIFDIDAPSSPGKYQTAQQTAFDAWYVTLPRNELLQRIEKMLEIAAAFGLDPMDDPRVHVSVAALRGDITQAIQVALSDVFTQPVTINLGWRNDFEQAQFVEFVEDPRVRAAMQNWEDEQTALQQGLMSFLSEVGSTS